MLLIHTPADDTGIEIIGLSWQVPGDIAELFPGAEPILLYPDHGAYEDFDFRADGCLVCAEREAAYNRFIEAGYQDLEDEDRYAYQTI